MYKVAVIGAGIIGLSTAVEIQEKLGARVNVEIFTSDKSPNTTADLSAGLWMPYLIQNTPEKDVIKWSKLTLEENFRLWKSGLASQAGISLQPTVYLSKNKHEKTPEWTKYALQVTELDETTLRKIGFGENETYVKGYMFMSFICEPVKYLPFLERQFLKNGGRIVLKTVKDFTELSDYDVIVNCSGLQAKYLTNDQGLEAVRGQIARVKAPWIFCAVMDDDHYIIPNPDWVILGGTHQEGDEDVRVRRVDYDTIFEGCTRINPSLERVDEIKAQVGLRPGRNCVRLEVEEKLINGKNLRIVHNYGHGGSGVTLNAGCAEDACSLVENLLFHKSKL